MEHPDLPEGEEPLVHLFPNKNCQGRRRFLGSIVGGGLCSASTIAGESSTPISQVPDNDWELSIADSLYLYTRLLITLQHSSLDNARQSAREAWNLFAAKFNELSEQAKRLKNLNPQLQSQAPVRKMQEVVKKGNKTIKPIKTVNADYLGGKQAYMFAISSITSQLNAVALELPQKPVGGVVVQVPDDRVILNSQEAQLLRRLLQLIEELQDLQRKVEDAFTESDEAFISVFKIIQKIEQLMMDASASVAEAEYPTTRQSSRLALRRRAASKIREALNELRNPLFTQAEGRSLIRNLLEALLLQIPVESNLRGAAKNMEDLYFTPAAYNTSQQANKPVPSQIRDGIRTIIAKDIPEAIWYKVVTCVILVWPILVAYEDVAKREELIGDLIHLVVPRSPKANLAEATAKIARLSIK